MLRDLITAKILNNLGFYPTKGQKLLASALGSFVSSGIDRELLLINGHAGTGKTSMIASLVRSFDEMKVKYRLMAPTGRASKVLSAYSGRVSSTIHRKIYRQKSSSDGFGDFALDKNLHTRTFFIVDEASMIHNAGQEASVFGSGRLLDDLIQYVYNNQDCKLILIGDTAQLPPVGLELGEALNPEFLKGYGLDVQSCYLNEVVRQAKKSGVLHNATKLREILDGEKLHIPAFDVDGFEDVVRINGQDLLDELESSIGSGNEDESIILTRSNSMANRYNQGIRNRILYREDELSAGDRLMIVKNNYFGLEDYPEMEFIANGDMAEISRIYRYEDVYGFRFADVCICLPDYNDLEMDVKVMLDTLSLNQPALSYSDQKKLYQNIVNESYPGLKSKKEVYVKMKKDPYYNALQIKFAWAVTCHKAQGGQWNRVFIDQGYFSEKDLRMEYIRWLYTAITRAKEKVYLVNFKDEFFI